MATRLIITVLLFFCTCPCFANPGVNWELLNLSDWQRAEIISLDSKWQKTSRILNEQIIYDKNMLKALIASPLSSDQEILRLQNRILLNQNKLSYMAMENFLQKRSLLNVLQKQRLCQILSN